MTDFLPEVVQMVSIMNFMSIRLTKYTGLQITRYTGLKLGVDFLLKNWEFRVFAKQPLSKKLGILRFRQTGHVQKIGTFIIRTGLIRNIFHPKTRSEAHFFVSFHRARIVSRLCSELGLRVLRPSSSSNNN